MDHDSGGGNDDVYVDSNSPAPNLGLEFFSEPPNSFTAPSSSLRGREGLPRRGSTGLDLNSQAMNVNDGTSFLDLLRSSSAGLLGEDDRAGFTGHGLPAVRGSGGGRTNGFAKDDGVALEAAGNRPSRVVGCSRGTARAVRRAAGRPASSRPPLPPTSRAYRAPRPARSQIKTSGAGSIAGDKGVAAAVQETSQSVHDPPAWDWSQNPYDEEADDDLDVEMNLCTSNDADEGWENCSSSDDDGMKKIALNQLELVQQYGAAACMFGMFYDATFMHKVKNVKTGLSGYEWVMATLRNPSACYNMYRMSAELFYKLHDTLVSTYGLKTTKKMSSVEALAMFLWVIGAPQSVRQTENRFERSTETISRKFNEVLGSVFRMSKDIVKPIDPEFRTVHPKLHRPPFSPHFDNCIGAIDGTHIPVVVPSSKLLQHVGRHNYTTQNVLAICDFDMRFTFAVAGWPGSVHDMRVFNDATEKYGDKFPHPPPGKFYLVDSGFPNKPGYLAPYKGTKYHFQQFRRAGPRGKKEVFNKVHSSLRNVIERAFGVLKMKWRILFDVPSYPTNKQTKIILACMALHNFIRQSAMRDQDFDMCDEDEEYMPMPWDPPCQEISAK